MMRLDQNRAATALARKAGVAVSAIDDLVVYGNHSPSMFPDFANARISGRPVSQTITDQPWLKETFIPTVGKRGAAIIEARGASSAFSAASALIDHVRALLSPGPAIHSIAVCSDGSYGFSPGVWAGMPVRTVAPGRYEIVTGIPHDDFALRTLTTTNAELVAERDTVKELLA
jgi:malate dehydrogenase